MWWKSLYGYSNLCNINTHTQKLIHCVAIFTILYGNYYPPHGEFKLICIGKFARRTWVNFTQQYGKNRQRCQQNTFYYAVWQLLLYFYREFPSKILAVFSLGNCFIFRTDNFSNFPNWKLTNFPNWKLNKFPEFLYFENYQNFKNWQMVHSNPQWPCLSHVDFNILTQFLNKWIRSEILNTVGYVHYFNTVWF